MSEILLEVALDLSKLKIFRQSPAWIESRVMFSKLLGGIEEKAFQKELYAEVTCPLQAPEQVVAWFGL